MSKFALEIIKEVNISQIIDKYTNLSAGVSYDTLYYYMPVSTFLNSVIKNGKITLWAGHIDYMEDRLEFEKGMGIIRSITEMDQAYALTIEHSIKNRFPFQLSFSRAKDCYPMWKIYGHGELAVMLMLDYGLMKKEFEFISECIYEDSEEYETIKSFIEGREWLNRKGQPKNNQVESFLLQFPYLAKDKHYAYEQEVRIFRGVRKNDDKLNYKISGNIVVPYKNFVFPKETLKGVMISPCTDEEFQLNKTTISLKLIEYGFTHLHYSNPLFEDSIVKSEILIRR